MRLRTKVIGWVVGGSIALATPLVMRWEGYESKVYLDPVGIPTVCYGHVVDGTFQVGQEFTSEMCSQILMTDLKKAESQVQNLVKVSLNPHEKAAFISFVYNAGAGNFRKSTMLKLINQGRIVEACHELPKWVYATKPDGTKVKLKGLVNRRQAEMRLCLGEE